MFDLGKVSEAGDAMSGDGKMTAVIGATITGLFVAFVLLAIIAALAIVLL